MLTYEYICTSCDNAWEIEQNIKDLPLTECPKCHKNTAKRQLSLSLFVLKGGGWFADGYSNHKTEKKL